MGGAATSFAFYRAALGSAPCSVSKPVAPAWRAQATGLIHSAVLAWLHRRL